MTGPAATAEQLLAEVARVRADAEGRLGAISDALGVEALRHEVLGRSGSLTALLRQLASVAPEGRPAAGAAANEARQAIEAAVARRLAELAGNELEARLAGETLDMSAPGRPARVGHLHPLMTVERDLREIFHGFGFEVIEGPEIESDLMNFELLNIPPDHPSRDLWDTLYVAEPGSVEAGQPRPAEDGTILRTHTSPVQIRAMRELTPPIRVIMPGRCFRYEAVDAAHGFEFFQVEGLVVDRDTSLADLKGTLEAFARGMWGAETRTRFRPGYYPFTEPSVAFDIGCLVCGGSGCPACGRTGWMTILGAGMVHPVVLRN
ncbi:MAG TPA: phenylalanine--tRNA ligase subunit alpha, partial [Candidatus Limnocylindria bacterium]|nr:phenylalanine--tRNA ligase subunit alpha [Candidatus Limnocylindria bacterium]